MKKKLYNEMLNECSNADQLEYLTVECSTRSKAIARKAKRLMNEGNFAEALRIADKTAYNVGYNEFQQ